jgi:hypothetical protein
MGIKGVWLWFVIQTISISLIMAWPLLKTSKSIRVIISFSLWVANEFIFIWLLPFKDQANGFGVLYYFLYNVSEQNVILAYFPFLLMGTVIGDTLYEIFSEEDPKEQKVLLKKKIYLPYAIGGTALTIFGIVFLFPAFFHKENFSSHLFIFGIELILIAFLVWFKDDKEYKPEKNYRLFIYYSYYSFSIFLGHNILYFLFPRMLNAVQIWFFIIPITIIWTLLWRYIYKKMGRTASVKTHVGNLAKLFSTKLEEQRKIKRKLEMPQYIEQLKTEKKEKKDKS